MIARVASGRFLAAYTLVPLPDYHEFYNIYTILQYRISMKSVTSRDTRYDHLRLVLVEARKAHGLTQVLLARKLKKLQSFVSNYERGARQLDVVEFIDIARVLGQKPATILRRLGS